MRVAAAEGSTPRGDTMTFPYTPPPIQRPPFHNLPPAQNTNGLATGGFVVSLCAAILSLIPVIGVVAWIVAPIGLVLSIIGIQRANRLGGRGLAVSGAVLGAIALVICSLW